jgi:uncharacterized hydrophobic protein (TIGR00271 family)
MRLVATNSLEHMRGSVFFEGERAPQKTSRFWILIILASIIAAAGVVGDSTATVIGAMIVAPLMTPILGTMLSVILADRTNLIRSLSFVVGGALVAIGIGFLLGLIAINPVVADTSSQVAGRVNPRLIDLLAALATGVVGSIAMVRSDISDTLPGVAIAISLVPPLAVVGLTMEAGAYDESLGALLLFLTNVTAILASGTIVMALYGVHHLAVPSASDAQRAVDRRKAVALIGIMAAIIVVPLAGTTFQISRETLQESDARAAAKAFADPVGWEVANVSTEAGEIVIELKGPLPLPDTAALRSQLDARGVDPANVRVELEPIEVVEFDE